MTVQTLIACGIALGALMGVPTASRAAQTIVGTWAPDPAACTPVEGMIVIGPRSINGDEIACEFRDVMRRGDVVTWHGRCGQPEPARPATVVARLAGGSLTVVIDGAASGPYRRCRPD